MAAASPGHKRRSLATIGSEPRRVLYLESSTGTGGSVRSLEEILQHLDAEFAPAVIFHERNQKVGALRAHASTFTFGANQPKLADFRRSWLIRKARGAVEYYLPCLDIPVYNLCEGQLVRRLEDVIDQVRPSLIHLNIDPASDFPGILAARNSRVPCISHLRTMSTRPPGQSRIAIANQTVAAYIANSEATRRHWEGHGLDSSKVVRIYNGLAPDSGYDLPLLRKKYDIPAHYRIVGCVGRFVSWKGQTYALNVFRRLLHRYKGLVLVLVGDGPEREALVNQVKRLNIEDRVIFTGFVDDARGIFADLDVVLVPSQREPFGRVVLEAMDRGTPVVATRVGGIPEIIEDEETGLLVSYGDVDGMATAVERLLEDEQFRKKLIKNAKRTVREDFDLEQRVREIEDLYRFVLKKTLSR